MRRVLRSRVRMPEVLSSQSLRSAKTELISHYRLADHIRFRQRAPVNEKLLASRDISDALLDVFFSKCAYCESPVDALVLGEVSHYRPIGSAAGLEGRSRDEVSVDHYGWLAYEWHNLFLACAECNRAKRNLFPVDGPRARVRSTWKEVEASEQVLLINPCREDPRKHLAFSPDGRAIPRTKVGGATIDVLSLNRESLVHARANKLTQCVDAMRKMRTEAGHQEGLREELDEAAPYSGSAQIALFNLLVEWSRLLEYPRPTFKTITEDAARLATVATDADWETFRSLARSETSLFEPMDDARAYALPVFRYIRTREGPRTSYLKTIRVRNFKGVSDLEIRVAPPKQGDVGAPCMMLLGENSTGKSSTLQAIALALMGDRLRTRIGVDAEDFIPREDSGWQIDESSPTEISLEFDTGEPISLGIDPVSREFIGAEAASFKLFAYGSRRFFDEELRRKSPVSSLKSLFNPFTKIQHPGPWLENLTDEQFDSVARAIRPVLALQKEDRIERDNIGRLFVHAHGRDTPLERLSDGYRSLMAMVLDIMRGMLEEWDDLYSAWGIVLIDEIETHLHPRWKRQVVSALREAMPNVQFIATTHDPLCLRGMRTDEVQVLARNLDHRLEALRGLPDVRGLRAEQLLTSEYFGLSSTAEPEVELALNRIAQPRNSDSPDEAIRAAFQSFQWIGDTPVEQVVNEALRRFVEEAGAEPALDKRLIREVAVSDVLERLRRFRRGGAE